MDENDGAVTHQQCRLHEMESPTHLYCEIIRIQYREEVRFLFLRAYLRRKAMSSLY
jgi:hypothetical protein